jgi:YVTN family beta-propeller protein
VAILLAPLFQVVPAAASFVATAPAPIAARAYAADVNNNNVDVIDTATNTVIDTIAVGNSPSGVAATPDGSTVYVTNEFDNTVSVIAAVTESVTATIAVGNFPVAVAVGPDGSHVYVVNQSDNTVSVIDAATGTVTATIAVGNFPVAVAVGPDGAHVYVVNQGDDTVSIIATATGTVTATPFVGSEPSAVAVNPDGKHVYVANAVDNTVSVIATATNTVTATIAVGNFPQGVAVNPDGKHAYVVNGFDNTVSVINTATNTVVATIAGGGQNAVAVIPDGTAAYAAGPGSNVAVDNLVTNTVTTTIPITGSILPNLLAIAVAPAPKLGSTTALSATPSAAFGSPVTFHAKVGPATATTLAPTGTVSFYLHGGAAPVATANLKDGTASFTTSGLGAGVHHVVATYSGDPNFAGSTATPATVTVTTTAAITGSHSGSIIVAPGETLLLRNAQVTGSVIVQQGGALDVENSTMAALIANRPAGVRVCASTVRGSLDVSSATGFVLLGDQGDDGCGPNRIGGSLVLTGNTGGLEAIGNLVVGALVNVRNSGAGAFPEDNGPEVSKLP